MSDVPPPHRRTLPDVAVSERGLRQLEIWLTDKLKGVIDKFTLAKLGETKLHGDVTLSEGTGIGLTQSGQNIEIGAPEAIRFNNDNEGGYLYVQSNTTAANGYGTTISDFTPGAGATAGIWIVAARRLTLQADSLIEGCGNHFLNDTPIHSAGGNFQYYWGAGTLTSGLFLTWANNTTGLDLLKLGADGTLEVHLGRTAAKFRVLDHLGNPAFEVSG